MSIRTSPIQEARRRTTWVLLTVGREIRTARHRSGMTQRSVGAAIGRSASWISRIESGHVRRVALAELIVVSAAVGLKLVVNAYPAWRRPLDAPQLDLLNRFNARLHGSWRRELEKVMPRHDDLRAVDELITLGDCACAVEAITRLADAQGQVRAARAKQRDLGAAHLILLVKSSHANRRMLREVGPILVESFPVGTRAALRALSAGRDPGGDCLIVL